MRTADSSSTLALLRDRLLFGLVIIASLVVLFAPSPPSPPLFPYADKVIHFTLFAALAWSGRRAGARDVPLAVALVAYAVGSEIVQTTLLAERSGSWTDALADISGVAVGLLAARVLPWRLARGRPYPAA